MTTDPLDAWRELKASQDKAARQTWAASTIGAVIVPDIVWCPSVQGPTAIPYVPWGWSERTNGPAPASLHPNHPGLYGRYRPIDLDENNRATIEAWKARNPDRPAPALGWGVCRHGFGLQDFGDGYMSREVAEARAIALNAGRAATDVANVAA